MNIQPISGAALSCKGTKRTENGNIYHTTNAGTLTGLIGGGAIGGFIAYRAIKAAPQHTKQLSIMGAVLTAITTGIGYLLDKNTELARSRMADGYIKPADFY